MCMVLVDTMHRREQPGEATTIRQPSTAQLLIDSLDRYPNGFVPSQGAATTSSNWRLNLQQLAMNGYIHRMAVSQIQFQWNIPTIVSGYNDTINFAYGGAAYTATIPGNWYNPDQLATAVEEAMNAVIPGGANPFTVTFNDVFEFVSNAATFVFLPQGTGINTTQRLYGTMGIIPGGTPNTIQSSNVPTMLATRFIDICSTVLTKYQRLKDTNTLPAHISSTCIARIFPVAPNTKEKITGNSSPGDAPFIVAIDYGSPKQIAWSPEEGIPNFDIQLEDENGELVPWSVTAGCEYNMVMLVSEN